MISVILPPLFGGIIGYVTNDIAIRMLFRPHTAKYIFGMHIPFTPGIIPKEKGRIAQEIGAAISENLMNKDVLEQYLLSDEMVKKLRLSVDEFVDKQKRNQETVKTFLYHYLSEQEVMRVAASVNDNLSKETYTKLTDPVIGETVSKVVMDYVGKILSGDGAKIILGGLGGLTKGLGGIAASLLGVDVVDKFLGLLREPAEKFLANNINNMLYENGQQIVADIIANEVDTFLNMPVSKLLEQHEEQLAQLPAFTESIYKNIITEHLPQILKSIDIRRIVSKRIEEMDMNELEPIILDVMDKELKAIVWFGAGLGALIGCINIFL